MKEMMLLVLIIIPALVGVISLLLPKLPRYLRETCCVVVTAGLVWLIGDLWGQVLALNIPWLKIPGSGAEIALQLRLYPLSQFIIMAIAIFTLLVTLFSTKFMADRPRNHQFYAMLFINEAMAIGAVLANNLVLMLFFWEGLLITLYFLISLGQPQAYKTAIKALIIVGLSDLCLLLGVTMVGVQANTLEMSKIQLSTAGMGGAAFILMLIGAMAKGGAMPFHTWIPDAATDAPLPFMALLPAALEKLVGIYLVARIALDFFTVDQVMRIVVMSIGALTIVLAVAMALIQKDFKRLLSYHAISQVGYMILGIGTGIPVGVAGGLFHMVNNAIYKSCLFFTGGAIERQAGTTDLSKLGGLARRMPLTFGCFAIAALSISGVPPFNGFVSKEMVFEGALETGMKVFFIAAVFGAIGTAASFLKLGHATFFGPLSQANQRVRETHWTMALPMVVLAGVCVLFGINFNWPLNFLIKPALLESLNQGLLGIYFKYDLSGSLFWVTVLVLAIAIFNHIYGVKTSGRGLGASDHIHHFPVLRQVYDLAEARAFDPYVQGRRVGYYVALGLYQIDRAVDWCYERAIPAIAHTIAATRKIHNGYYANYLSWSLGGLALILYYLVWVVK